MKNRNEKYFKRQIIIMSDFGDAIFWDKNGINIGDSDGIEDYNISKELLKEFSDWHFIFERFDFKNDPNFSWTDYHKKGMELAAKLKKELKNNFEIYYEKPYEDPFHGKNDRLLIE